MLTSNHNLRYSPDNSFEGGSLSGSSLTPSARHILAPRNWSLEESKVLGTLLLALGLETRIAEVGSRAGSSPREIGGYWTRYIGYEMDPNLVAASQKANEGRQDLEFHAVSEYSSSIAKTIDNHGLFSMVFCREDKLAHFGAHPAQQLSQLLQFANVLAVVTHPSSGQINGTDLHGPSRTTNPPNSKAGFTIPELLSFAKAIPGHQSFSLRSAGPGAAVLIISRLPEVPGTSLFERMDYFDATRND